MFIIAKKQCTSLDCTLTLTFDFNKSSVDIYFLFQVSMEHSPWQESLLPHCLQSL